MSALGRQRQFEVFAAFHREQISVMQRGIFALFFALCGTFTGKAISGWIYFGAIGGQLRSFGDLCRLPTDRQQRLRVPAFRVAASTKLAQDRNIVAGMTKGEHDLSKGSNRAADDLGVNRNDN
jgi:hypothetical protein